MLFSKLVFEPASDNTVPVKVERELKTYDPNAHWAFVGDSHVFTSIDSRIIPEAFAYAHINETYVQTYYTLRKLLQERPDITIVFLQYDFHNLVEKHRDWDAIYFWRNIIDPVELDLTTGTLPYYSFLYGFAGRIAPYINSLTILIKSHIKSTRKIIANGFVPRLGLSDIKQSDIDARMDTIYHAHDKIIQINPNSIKYLTKILDLLTNHNVKIVLLRYPMHPAFYKQVTEFMDVSYSDTVLENLQKNYDFVFLDYRTLLFDQPCQGLRCPYFKDSDHLNLEGAMVFSQRLKSDTMHNSFFAM